ncbi:MAG TPA: DUF4432 family protein [Conexibacter sp.]|jgi:hypothetical protein|nr:DUF4432 family protein [Conexibacter sp.]
MSGITLANDHLTVQVHPEAGAEISRLSRPGGPNALAWYDWASPLPATRGPGYGNTALDWLSRFRGGWQELFPNAGDECEVNGVPLAFHGEASLAAWDVVEVSPAACTLRTAVRLPLVLTRRMTLSSDRAALLIEESVVNESELETPFLWGHHPAFPAVPGAHVDLPSCQVRAEPRMAGGLGDATGAWPHLLDEHGHERALDVVPDEQVVRIVYAEEMTGSWAALRQPGELPSIAMAWDGNAFPVMWLWLQNGTSEFPWYGRANVVGLETHTAAPFDGLAAACERGQAHRLGPRETMTAWFTISLIDDPGSPVTGVDRDGSTEAGGDR